MLERDPASVARANAATLIALFGLLLIGGGLLGLMALVLPQVLGVLVVVGVVFVGPIALHYLVWGWRLPLTPDDAAARDEAPHE